MADRQQPVELPQQILQTPDSTFSLILHILSRELRKANRHDPVELVYNKYHRHDIPH